MSDANLIPSPAPVSAPSSVEAFRDYCRAELERRRNSGEAFDEAMFNEAMALALRKLEILEDEGLA